MQEEDDEDDSSLETLPVLFRLLSEFRAAHGDGVRNEWLQLVNAQSRLVICAHNLLVNFASMRRCANHIARRDFLRLLYSCLEQPRLLPVPFAEGTPLHDAAQLIALPAEPGSASPPTLPAHRIFHHCRMAIRAGALHLVRRVRGHPVNLRILSQLRSMLSRSLRREVLALVRDIVPPCGDALFPHALALLDFMANVVERAVVKAQYGVQPNFVPFRPSLGLHAALANAGSTRGGKAGRFLLNCLGYLEKEAVGDGAGGERLPQRFELEFPPCMAVLQHALTELRRAHAEATAAGSAAASASASAPAPAPRAGGSAAQRAAAAAAAAEAALSSGMALDKHLLGIVRANMPAADWDYVFKVAYVEACEEEEGEEEEEEEGGGHAAASASAPAPAPARKLLPFLIQDKDGPCAVLALFNYFVHSSLVQLPAGLTTVPYSIILNLLVQFLEMSTLEQLMSADLLHFLHTITVEELMEERAEALASCAGAAELIGRAACLPHIDAATGRYRAAPGAEATPCLDGSFEPGPLTSLMQRLGVPYLHGYVPAPGTLPSAFMRHMGLGKALVLATLEGPRAAPGALGEFFPHVTVVEQRTPAALAACREWVARWPNTVATPQGLAVMHGFMQSASVALAVQFSQGHFYLLRRRARDGALYQLLTQPDTVGLGIRWRRLAAGEGGAVDEGVFCRGDFSLFDGREDEGSPTLEELVDVLAGLPQARREEILTKWVELGQLDARTHALLQGHVLEREAQLLVEALRPGAGAQGQGGAGGGAGGGPPARAAQPVFDLSSLERGKK